MCCLNSSSTTALRPNSIGKIQMQKLPLLESCKIIEGVATAGRMRSNIHHEG